MTPCFPWIWMSTAKFAERISTLNRTARLTPLSWPPLLIHTLRLSGASYILAIGHSILWGKSSMFSYIHRGFYLDIIQLNKNLGQIYMFYWKIVNSYGSFSFCLWDGNLLWHLGCQFKYQFRFVFRLPILIFPRQFIISTFISILRSPGIIYLVTIWSFIRLVINEILSHFSVFASTWKIIIATITLIFEWSTDTSTKS